MLEFLAHLSPVGPFLPRVICLLWDSAAPRLQVIADLAVAAAYYAIPLLLFHVFRRRRDVPFHWIFAAFTIFIVACGTTHLLAAIAAGQPVYRFEGVVKAVAALAAAATFLMLAPLMPALIALPSPSQLKRANDGLAEEIQERRAAEAEVRRINEDLEQRVASRTADYKQAGESLQQALHDLRAEMNRREDLEEQLIQSQKMEAMGRLAGGVAHDFNNLLTVILGYSEMLCALVEENPLAREYAGEAMQASERASALTNQLLAFSRRQVAMPRIVDLNLVVRDVDKMLRRIIGEDIHLNVRLDPALPPVRVDPAHIGQVIVNLAVNSRDAMPNGGDITIETGHVTLGGEQASSHGGLRPGSYALLRVSDTGTGMDAATRARIFEPFFTTKAKGKGTGLGLSIVYGIVKQNGGEILVSSEPGHGTVFNIYIPSAVAAEALPAAAAESAAEFATGQSAGTILLVEDEEQVRNLARTILTREGYRVLDCESGAGALRAIGEQAVSIDLLLTDIVMPNMSGPDLAREVQSSHPGIKLLFMSGYAGGSVDSQGTIAAGTPFIRKPFTPASLRRKVHETLRADIVPRRDAGTPGTMPD